MSVEIERKYLVDTSMGAPWRSPDHATHCLQGYLASDPTCTVRIRLMGDKAFLTIKGITTGISRPEFEYPIPPEDAVAMLRLMASESLIEKIRYTYVFGGHLWEIDEFMGKNAGLLLAEVELSSEEQAVEKPPWVVREVTGDPRYYNVSLAKNPFSTWEKQEKENSCP